MTIPTLVLALTVGAAPLALWVFVRMDGLAPRGIGASAVHVGVSLAFVNFAGPVLMQAIVGHGESAPRALVALFAVYLPALVYAFLSGLWVLSGLARRLRPG